ncbi:MAG: UDP-N-acetylglucosamine 2-epimerase (non-hydrolyzing) [Patescibacteria group bacterium]|nr:UDP-N-acetylglucosamine 2-epimerase (non-hydrolyzing) [Patescibacteria group bacterium]
MKVCTIVGTRPEIIKLSRVIPELDKHVHHVLLHTGQNYDYGLNGIFFKELGLRLPDIEQTPVALDDCPNGPAARVGWMMCAIETSLKEEQPDAVLILGDTNSAIAAAYAAKRQRLPIFHAEAGNRCFDERVPEEVNRRIIDHIADINMPYTEHARRNLLAEGIAPDRIIKTGSPMCEVLGHYAAQIARSDILDRLSLTGQGYYVVSAHREENVDAADRLPALTRVVDRLAKSAPVVWSVHPRTARRLPPAPPHNRVIMHEPFGFPDYMQLQINALCVISDSGTLTEEADTMQFPAVQIRQAHERPEGMDAGTLIMSDLVEERVLDAVRVAVEHGPVRDHIYDNVTACVSKKVVRTILSYTDYVRRNVWRQA